MLPINNSDTAWLIVSDFNQDNSIGYSDCLREDIANPEINQDIIDQVLGSGAGTRYSNIRGVSSNEKVGWSWDTHSAIRGVGANFHTSTLVGGHYV
jgi:hypothetical protein